MLPTEGCSSVKHDWPKASNTVVPSTFKKPLGGAKRMGKTGRLGARKLTTKTMENLYDQEPEEVAPVIPAVSSTNNGRTKSPAGLFKYNDDLQPSTCSMSKHPSRFSLEGILNTAMKSRGGTLEFRSHVTPPEDRALVTVDPLLDWVRKSRGRASGTLGFRSHVTPPEDRALVTVDPLLDWVRKSRGRASGTLFRSHVTPPEHPALVTVDPLLDWVRKSRGRASGTLGFCSHVTPPEHPALATVERILEN
ncbi:unnamed protein product [Arabis nemorensis]|uniref:Uncharacterized protein n=1 Tax=Arabis nemorensis TaxID=586526 RepID=A0A565CGF5_9BRAS|nr:unnamed protein product [Arabis nemorensis]